MQMREYLDYTGDIEFLREKYPMMKKLLSTFLNKDRENGLIENFYGEGGYWNFYEWSETMEGRFNETVRSIEAPINAYLSLALSDFAYIADKLGFGEDAEAYEAEKAVLNNAIKTEFYNEKTKLFESFLDRHQGTYSVLTNSLCLLCGAADGIDKSVIFEILSNNGAGKTGLKVVPNTLSMNSFRFDALLKSDEEKFAPVILDEIRREYGKMLDAGATTFWETSLGEADFDNAGSLCHGWSALPVYYFHRLLK
jgi:glycogen debranching enzyme